MRRVLLFAAIFLIGTGVGQLISLIRTPSKVLTPQQAEISSEATTTSVLSEVSEGERVVVARVIDGDTIELSDGRKLRYIGIDTPELVHPQRAVECFARQAKEENKRLVDSKTVRLEKDISETDKYGRLLRYVYVGEVMINEALVRQGFALASTYPPDVKYQERLLAAQQEARENNRGLWAGCTNPTPEVRLPQATGFQPGTLEERDFGAGQSACLIKGNISSSGEKIYHLPGCGSYAKTVIDESAGERWFCTEEEALKAGWRKAKNC